MVGSGPMADLLLYGTGWTQRWTIKDGHESEVRSKIMEVGNPSTGLLTVIDPNTEANVTLVVNWRLVAVALVLEDHAGEPTHGGSYA